MCVHVGVWIHWLVFGSGIHFFFVCLDWHTSIVLLIDAVFDLCLFRDPRMTHGDGLQRHGTKETS